MKISEVYFHYIREIMRILSIDVGIKNLALCVFDVSPGFSVVEWKTVNLIAQDEPVHTHKCTCCLAAKNKKNGTETLWQNRQVHGP